MEIIGPLLLSFVAGISTVLGSIFIFLKTKKIQELITFCLSFSFIIMLSISLFDLIPESFQILLLTYKHILGLFIAILAFILGNVSIRVINGKISHKNSSGLYRVGVLSLISLILHNLPEGIAVFMSTYTNFNLGLKLCIAIMMHNIPEGIVISVPLYHSGISKKKVILYTLFSGLIEPIGGLIGYLLLKNIMNDIILAIILIFVAGLMTNLAIKDIFEEAISYNKRNYMIYGIISGTIFFIIALLL